MRFVTFHEVDGDRAGVLDGDQVCTLEPGVRLIDLIGDPGRLEEAGERALRHPQAVYAYGSLHLRAPIPSPPSVRDFMTFERHVAGVAKLRAPDAAVPGQWYAAPAFYFTNPYAVQGPEDGVRIPPGSSLFDFELEVAAVIGRGGRDIRVADAEQHIAGYMLMNDWSARDLQFAEMQVHLGPAKGKDSATSLGPVLVTPDEVADRRAGNAFGLTMTAQVNGTVIGQDLWSEMGFSYAQMIAYASRGTEVRTGDILGSGTCGGGCLAELWGRKGLDAHPPLSAGDTVVLTVEQLGSQSVTVLPADPQPLEDLSIPSTDRSVQ
ncbi:fumarylacetoacetate hydrolase family protein [Streptomyces sp. NPDC090493]|uniref:fumarylacetoacetate hydrolase family protein n=1 Tax=Streptomyces sp. NPDC090493 TaxID=3365964 RepID=UPI00381C815B